MSKETTELFAEDDNGISRNQRIAMRQDASEEMALKVLQSPVSDNGRSNFCWFRLANGDLVLGVYPCGDMYFETEGDRSI